MPILEENILNLQQKYNLSYHIVFSKYCDDLVGFADKDILEVGGSLPPEFVFEQLKVKSWTALESGDYVELLADAGGIDHTGTQLYDNCKKYPLDDEHAKIDERYRFFIGNVEHLSEKFYSKFDLIFSINCFEHLQNLPESLDKMNMALRKGGKLFAISAPIWTAFDGHHLPRITDKNGKIYHQGESPIPPWGHLTMTSTEMNEYLSKHVDKNTAAKMVYYIYDSPHINRLFPEDYKQYFEMSDLQIERYKTVFRVTVSPEKQIVFKKLLPDYKQFSYRGMLLIASRLN